MTAMIQAATPEHRPAHIVRTAVFVVLFWALAAFIVIALHGVFGSKPAACTTLQTLAIVLSAFAYMRMGASEPTIDHALFAGAAWLVLAVVTELGMTTHSGRGWFALLGSPTSALRNVLMFAWILAPALFATHRK